MSDMITYDELRRRVQDLLERTENRHVVKAEEFLENLNYTSPDFDVDQFLARIEEYLKHGEC